MQHWLGMMNRGPHLVHYRIVCCEARGQRVQDEAPGVAAPVVEPELQGVFVGGQRGRGMLTLGGGGLDWVG